MGRAWQVQEAKARFSEFLETSLTEGAADRNQARRRDRGTRFY